MDIKRCKCQHCNTTDESMFKVNNSRKTCITCRNRLAREKRSKSGAPLRQQSDKDRLNEIGGSLCIINDKINNLERTLEFTRKDYIKSSEIEEVVHKSSILVNKKLLEKMVLVERTISLMQKTIEDQNKEIDSLKETINGLKHIRSPPDKKEHVFAPFTPKK